MEAFKQVWKRLIELYRRLSPNARLTAALAAAAVIVCLGWATRSLFTVDTIYLLGGKALTTEELTEMQSALAKAQLNDFVVEGNRIRVPRERQAQYIAALAENRALPESVPDMLSEAIDKVNLFTNGQQQADYKEAARLKSLTSILRSFDGVETAEVVFDKTETRALRPERTMTALVAIKLREGRPLDEDRAAMFRSVLTAAIAGLMPQNVTVVDKATNRSHHYQADQASGAGGRYRDSKRAYEAQYEARVRHALEHVPGVIVSAEIELAIPSRRDPGATSTGQAPPQLPSVANADDSALGGAIASQGAANQPLDLTPPSDEPSIASAPIAATFDAKTPLASTTSVTTTQSQFAPRELAAADLDALVPRRVCLSIGVPVMYFENVWRQRLAAPSAQRGGAPAPDLEQVQAQELANIRHLAAPFVQGASGSVDSANLLTVTPISTMTFEPAPQPSLLATASGWLTSPWGPLAVVLSLIGGISFFKSTMRTARSEVADTARAGDQVVAAPARSRTSRVDEPATPKPSSPFHERLATTNSLRNELADMVREDPDVAANILRTWIGNSST
jgi:flagellar M-ring protein FliF